MSSEYISRRSSRPEARGAALVFGVWGLVEKK